MSTRDRPDGPPEPAVATATSHRTTASSSTSTTPSSHESAGLKPGEPVIGFSLPTRDAVDDTYQALVAAGHPARLEPYDAFFGARYAIVSDPDGHNIGLMSPIDADRRLTPNRDGRPVTS